MIKKIFVALVITVVFGAAVWGIAKSTSAQAIDTPEVEQVTEPVLEAAEEEIQAAEGECPYDGEALQTRTRQQLNDGTCDGECPNDGEQSQIRNRQQLNQGTCEGECISDGEQAKSQMRQQLGDGTCEGNELLQNQMRQGNQSSNGAGQRNGGK